MFYILPFLCFEEIAQDVADEILRLSGTYRNDWNASNKIKHSTSIRKT